MNRFIYLICILSSFFISSCNINSKNVDKSVKFQMIKDRSKKIKLNEQNIIKSFTKNYNKNEKMKYFNKQKKIAFWNTVVKPYADLKEQIQKWIKDRKKLSKFSL